MDAAAEQMPLFPLDLVLFPHMLLPLHIFEERYKEMVDRCVRESRPFGIVLITEGSSVGSHDTRTCRIGCSARIAGVERLPGGAINIEVTGEQRFRLLDTHEALPYRVGLTEPIFDAPADAATVVPLADEVQTLLRDFLTRSLALAGEHVVEFSLPDEPEQLSFTAACVLPIGNDEKQALLEDTDTSARLYAEKKVLLRELSRLRRAAENVAALAWEPVTTQHYADWRCPN